MCPLRQADTPFCDQVIESSTNALVVQLLQDMSIFGDLFSELSLCVKDAATFLALGVVASTSLARHM